jgi:dienelactone hydrolase
MPLIIGLPRRTLVSLRATIVALLGFGFLQARADDLIEQSMRIPIPNSGKDGLDAVMVRPNDSAAHPLALLTHGTPRESIQREGTTAQEFVPQAREFARRGWTTVMVVRRGFGSSGGGYHEEGRSCSRDPDYYDAGKHSAEDLSAAITYLSTLPQVDASRIISVGVSTGGFAQVALSAEPPKGLLAAISFAGGRGSKKPDEVCNPGDLIRAFGEFGRRSRVPMLWIYAQNDHFFGPQLAAQFFRAFTEAGGKANFVLAAPFRKDGHGLYSARGIPIWAPVVDGFLQAQNLKLRDSLLALPTPPDVAPPDALSAAAREEFRAFLTYPAHKAFSMSGGGEYGYAYGRRSKAEAEKAAASNCDQSDPKGGRCQEVLSD